MDDEKTPVNEQYLQLKREFQHKYKNNFLPFLTKLKEKTDRLNLPNKRKYNYCMRLTIPGAIVTFLSIFWLGYRSTHEIIAPFILAGMCTFWITVIYITTIDFLFYSKTPDIKPQIMDELCKLFNNLTWINGRELQGCGIYKKNLPINTDYLCGSSYKEAGLITNYNKYYFDDIFAGSWNGVGFSIIESKFIKNISKHLSIQLFKGIFIVLDMNKNFEGQTVIKNNKPLTSGNFMQQVNDDFFNNMNLKEIVLEDVDFNKKYSVYSTDEIEARYLITPSFMTRLKKINTAFAASGIRCSFYKNCLMLGIETDKNLFEVSLYDDIRQYLHLFDEIMSIIMLIDHLKLNQKIGL